MLALGVRVDVRLSDQGRKGGSMITPEIKPIKLSDIVTTAGTQIRARIDQDTVAEYAEAMKDASNKFPPVVVFHDGSQFILGDGFHRALAATRNGFKDILAEVRTGTKADALKYALGANTAHGLRRTNSDKRRSVVLALAEWPKVSDREIARICAVSNNFVSDTRKTQLSSNDSSEKPEKRTGADGRTRRVPKRKPRPKVEKASEPSPAPEPEEPPRIRTAIEEMTETESKPEQKPERIEPTPGIKMLPELHAALDWLLACSQRNLVEVG
jgi:hypothetical protein